MGRYKFHLALLGCLHCLSTTPLTAEDWPHWRGPTRNDLISESSGWPGTCWKDPQVKWKKTVGEGSTSSIIVGEKLYVMGWHDQQDILHCLDSSAGSELWSISYKCPRYGRQATGDEGLYSGPTSTPEYDTQSGYLYTLSCDGDLNCWNTSARGEHVWSINLYDSFTISRRPRVGRSGQRDYGYTTAPLIHGDWLIVEVGAKEGTLMAFEKETGKLVWKSQAAGPAGHAGGLVLMNVQGIPCVAAMTFHGLLVTRIDGKNAGKTIATYDWVTDFANNIATPAVLDNCVLITSGYNQDAICKLEITPNGAKKIWQQKFASKICTPVIHNGNVYWAWQRLHCLDFETGEQKWEGGSFSDAGSCIATADDRMIVWGGRGKLALVETADRSPDKYQEIANIKVGFNADVWPHVALSNGRIYCKDRDGHLVCFEMNEE